MYAYFIIQVCKAVLVAMSIDNLLLYALVPLHLFMQNCVIIIIIRF